MTNASRSRQNKRTSSERRQNGGPPQLAVLHGGKAQDAGASEPLPAVSLFTGAGGLDLGLVAASGGRLEIRAAVEIDPDARATLSRNRDRLESEDAPIFEDITEVQPSTLMSSAEVASGETFLLAGGPPCQSF